MSAAEDPNLKGFTRSCTARSKIRRSMNAALLESVAQKSAHHHKVIDEFLRRMGRKSSPRLEPLRMFIANGRLFTMGNGGRVATRRTWRSSFCIRSRPDASR